MRFVIISDSFPPLCNSAAVQMQDLAFEFAKQGHMPTVLIPDPLLRENCLIEEYNGVRIVRLRSPKIRDIGYVQRTVSEFWMPFSMMRSLDRSSLASERWDGVVWYSPSIFFGPIVKKLKLTSNCRSYLILRDIFPEWAVDIGLMGKGLPYLFFKAIEKYQYSVADVIGVQTPGNQAYFPERTVSPNRRVEVLQNWLAEAPDTGCSISVKKTPLAGRKIFVYAGNMGVAQGMGILLDLAEALINRKDLGFLFVGRGSDVPLLRTNAAARNLDNVAFFDGIDPSEIPGLYAQCHVGLVALDPRHKSHNIPGKFLSYMQCGLPVLATINSGNDLAKLIEGDRVGRVSTDSSIELLGHLARTLIEDIAQDHQIKSRCKDLAARLFSTEAAVRQIVKGLQT